MELLCLALACTNPPRLSRRLAAGASWTMAARYTSAHLPAIIRDLFGNPFRPASAGAGCLTATVASLAEVIYAERAFDRLPVLADALEEAGCEDGVVLGHCRGDGPHVRGCWVVDMLLGKE